MFSPDLDTARLHLRNMSDDHLDFVFRHFGHPDVFQYLVDEEPVTTLEQAREIVTDYKNPERTRSNRWILELKSDGSPVGTAGFHVYDATNRSIEIGYDLHPAHWGHGLMTEAVQAALDHVFQRVGVHRVAAWVHVENERSSNLLERLGFVREGTVRAKYWARDAWHDHHLYALLESDRA